MTRRGEPLTHYLAHRADITNECMIWPYRTNGPGDTGGYGLIYFESPRTGARSYLVHALACRNWNGPPPTPQHHAAHGPCHNRRCWNGQHLSWKTSPENTHDRARDGTNRGGPAAKTYRRLKPEQVNEIRHRYASQGHTPTALANEYRVNYTTIEAILGTGVRPQTWRHLL